MKNIIFLLILFFLLILGYDLVNNMYYCINIKEGLDNDDDTDTSSSKPVASICQKEAKLLNLASKKINQMESQINKLSKTCSS